MQGGRPLLVRRVRCELWVEGEVGLHTQAQGAYCCYGLPGAAAAVLHRLGEPVQGGSRNGFELDAVQDPVLEMVGQGPAGGGDEPVLFVPADVQVGRVRRQGAVLSVQGGSEALGRRSERGCGMRRSGRGRS